MFKIVEGDDFFEEIHDEFLELYLAGVKVKDIQKKLGINKSQYQNYLKKLRREGAVTTVRNPNGGQKKITKYNHKNPKNYHYNRETKSFHVVRKGKFYAKFKKEDDAKLFVKLMRECDWDFDRRLELKERVLNG